MNKLNLIYDNLCDFKEYVDLLLDDIGGREPLTESLYSYVNIARKFVNQYKDYPLALDLAFYTTDSLNNAFFRDRMVYRGKSYTTREMFKLLKEEVANINSTLMNYMYNKIDNMLEIDEYDEYKQHLLDDMNYAIYQYDNSYDLKNENDNVFHLKLEITPFILDAHNKMFRSHSAREYQPILKELIEKINKEVKEYRNTIKGIDEFVR